jgi:hypothetical protein
MQTEIEQNVIYGKEHYISTNNHLEGLRYHWTLTDNVLKLSRSGVVTLFSKWPATSLPLHLDQ